ncbi:MAG: hypothetical protein AUJ82_08060 [Verrucomicrobia bacterium CG1_02_43_26]|nr:MAG: hypothetical protein AUJ82_08060 [Verrucomicrobia bacterium CG1_02_43_26]
MNANVAEQLISHDRYVHEIIPHLKEKAEYAFHEKGVPGAAIAVVHKQHGTYVITYGVRELGKSDLVDKDSVFRIASLSKSFTGVMVAKLAEEGKLGLDDPVKKHLPELGFKDASFDQSLKLKHLLSHTSGFSPYTLDDDLEAGVPYPELIERIKLCAPVTQPGQTYAYQNVVFSLLGEVVKKKTGLSYEDALKKYLFKPLGMKNSSATHEGYLVAEKQTTPHVEKGGKMVPKNTDSLYYRVAPAGGINASIQDMSLWLKAYLGMIPYVASDKLLEEVQKPRTVTVERFHKLKIKWADGRVSSTHYGYGIRNFDYAGHPLLFHAGLLSGFGSVMALLPEQEIGIVILMNANTSAHIALMADFLDDCLALNNKDWVGQWIADNKRNPS